MIYHDDSVYHHHIYDEFVGQNRFVLFSLYVKAKRHYYIQLLSRDLEIVILAFVGKSLKIPQF